MARSRPPSDHHPRARARRRTSRPARSADAVSWRSAFPAPHPPGRATWPAGARVAAEDTPSPEILRVPVLAEGADPGRTTPSPLAVRDRMLVDRRLVGDHEAERLFAYEVTPAHMKHLRGLASPGDRVVFRRGGRVTPDHICAVRTPAGIVLARVSIKGRLLLLLPGEGGQEAEPVEVAEAGAPAAVAGTQVLLIRR